MSPDGHNSQIASCRRCRRTENCCQHTVLPDMRQKPVDGLMPNHIGDAEHGTEFTTGVGRGGRHTGIFGGYLAERHRRHGHDARTEAVARQGQGRHQPQRRVGREQQQGRQQHAGAGVLLSALLLLSSHPSLWLMATLALAGYGFGSSVVPMTSVALSEVPPQRSGMAASATNTSRELGAVFGVAVLGALVNAHLTAGLTGRLHALKIPANFIAVIINAVETGIVPSGLKGGGSIEDKVIVAAYAAFRDGLQTALLASGIALLVAAVVAATTLADWG